MSTTKNVIADALKSRPKRAGKKEAKGRSMPKSIGARVTVEEKAELVRLCAELGIDESTLVRRALGLCVGTLPDRLERAVNLARAGDSAPVGIDLCPWLRALRNTVDTVNEHVAVLDAKKEIDLDAENLRHDCSHSVVNTTASYYLGKKRAEQN